MTRYATGRDTDVASELEHFLDNESNNISPYIFDELEVVAEKIDEMVNEILTNLQDTHGDNEELKTKNEELETRIEELEESK